jgi:ATP phosphoribosyltransferase
VKKLPKPVPRSTLRMGLPSKGRMAEDTIQLLKVNHYTSRPLRRLRRAGPA